MTKREAERLTHQENTLMSLGFTREEAEALRRISMTLQRWYERECGDGYGCIERDEATGKPYWLNSYTSRRTPVPDRETGARRRLDAILKVRNARTLLTPSGRAITEQDRSGVLTAYLQTDPRGAALYIIRPGDVPDGGDVSSYYTRGVCVY